MRGSARVSLLARAPLAFVLLSLAAVLPGCPSNMCLLEVNGQCKFSSCGSREQFDAKRKLCVCYPGYITLGGSCLTQAEANKHCGKGAVFTPQGCAPLTCAPGFIADLENDQCVPKSAVDKAAGVGPGQTLACAQGTVLVVTQGQSSCVPAEQTCAKDEAWNGGACVKLPTCQPGYDIDRTTMTCAMISRPPTGGDDLGTVDVTQWARGNFGPNGGQGAPGLCGPLAKKPLTFGVMPGGSIRVVVNVGLSFPNGMVDSASVASGGVVEASGQPVTPKGAAEIQAAAETLVASLKSQKARSSAGQVPTTVRCMIVNAAPPVAVPSTGGA